MPRSTEPTSAADVDPDVMAVDAVAPPPRRAFLVERVDVLAAIALGGALRPAVGHRVVEPHAEWA